MAGANNAARSDNPDPQFMIIFLHRASNGDVDLGTGPRSARVNFDHFAWLLFNSESLREQGFA
jgi:hypothetical protein